MERRGARGGSEGSCDWARGEGWIYTLVALVEKVKRRAEEGEVRDGSIFPPRKRGGSQG